MKPKSLLRMGSVLGVLIVVSMGVSALRTEAAAQKCPRGVRSCSAAQAGQPCDPKNPNLICSAQSGGGYCCLAVAP